MLRIATVLVQRGAVLAAAVVLAAVGARQLRLHLVHCERHRALVWGQVQGCRLPGSINNLQPGLQYMRPDALHGTATA